MSKLKSFLLSLFVLLLGSTFVLAASDDFTIDLFELVGNAYLPTETVPDLGSVGRPFGTIFGSMSGGAPDDATYITQTPDASLSAEQAMSLLGTGLVKNTTGTGVLSIGVDGTDYITSVVADTTPQLGGDLDLQTFNIIAAPSANQALLAANPIVVNSAILEISGSGGAVTLTSVPTIADGSDGECIKIVGTDDTNTLTIQDDSNLSGSNLQLSGALDFIFGIGNTMELCWFTSVGDWVEFSRSDN